MPSNSRQVKSIAQNNSMIVDESSQQLLNNLLTYNKQPDTKQQLKETILQAQMMLQKLTQNSVN